MRKHGAPWKLWTEFIRKKRDFAALPMSNNRMACIPPMFLSQRFHVRYLHMLRWGDFLVVSEISVGKYSMTMDPMILWVWGWPILRAKNTIRGASKRWCIFPLLLQLNQIWSNYSDLARVFTPNGGLVREVPLFQGNLGWWNIIIWPDQMSEHILGFS